MPLSRGITALRRGALCVYRVVSAYVNHAALQAGRLPDRFFQPHAMLHPALERLHRGGTLFIVNQGEQEARVQAEHLANATQHVEALGRIDSVFSRFTQPRYAWRVLKP